jgi:hypothetical protein
MYFYQSIYLIGKYRESESAKLKIDRDMNRVKLDNNNLVIKNEKRYLCIYLSLYVSNTLCI